MKYTVSAVCIKRLFRVQLPDDDGNEPNGEYEIPELRNIGKLFRDEVIDTDKNEIFKGCKNEYAVEDRYEEFWNRLNGGYKNSEIVKVVNVVKEEESK